MDGVFVTGTDTGVGKTTVCAGLLKLLYGFRRVCYWKPVQTGTLIGDDTSDVKELTDLSGEAIAAPVFRFPQPQSPHLAAQLNGERIEIDTLVKNFEARKQDGFCQIIEGAGGLLVPLNDKQLLVDFIKRLKLPVLIVGTNKLGVINSTLLTVRVCRAESIEVFGIILTKSRRALNRGNAESIVQFGKVDVLAELDETEDRRSLVSQVSCSPRLRALFKVPIVPI